MGRAVSSALSADRVTAWTCWMKSAPVRADARRKEGRENDCSRKPGGEGWCWWCCNYQPHISLVPQRCRAARQLVLTCGGRGAKAPLGGVLHTVQHKPAALGAPTVLTWAQGSALL